MTQLSASDIETLGTDLMMAGQGVEQYIIFTIGDQEYGVGIMAVREIRGWTAENHLPNLPPYVRGVINLRGIVIPIIDLRVRFGGSATQPSSTHVVIVMQTDGGLKGVLVDAISDILSIPRDQIKPAPDMAGDGLDSHYIAGLYTPEGRIIALLGVAEICTTALH